MIQLRKLMLASIMMLTSVLLFAQSNNCSPATTYNTLCVPVAGTNAGATSGPEDSYAAADICAASVENTVWYTFTAPVADTYTLTMAVGACAPFNAGLQVGVLTGPCGGPYTSLNCGYMFANATSSFTFTIGAGQQVWIVIDGDGGDECPFNLDICGTACGADAGTVTVLEDGAPAASPIYLCANTTNCLSLTSNNDFTLPTAQPGEIAELFYALYTCPPTTADPATDPCYSGSLWSGQDFSDCNPSTYGLTGTFYFVPITADDGDNGGDPNGVIHYDQNGDGCFDMGTPIQVTYLNPITFAATENCDGSVDIVISGGMPEEDASNYTITNTGSGTLTPGTVTHGGTATITGLSNGQSYSLSVTDSEGCTFVYSGAVFSSFVDPSFSYTPASYCVADPDPTPTVVTGGGAFTSAPAGLSINGTTGVIDVSASTPNTYTITYTVSGCSSNFNVTITALDDASFNYSAASYCVNDPDPTPTITGVGGGSFTSSPAGLVINGTTGAIDVSASTPNTYAITYTTTGSCANSSNVNVTINALDDASFNYSAAAYCVNDPDPTPTITGLGSGTFTSSPAGLSINGTTGAIDVSLSTPNTYTITYTTTGACPNSSNVDVTINALDDASFNYSAAAYCLNDPDPTPTITGLGGGSFTSSPAGLVINGATGAIDVSASTPNTYTITYTTTGTCSNSSNVNVTINALDDASFNYSAAAYCVNDPDPTPTITGLGGGSFTSSPAGLVINGATGAIDVSASTPNTYTITYTTVGTCPNSSNVNVTINALDDASFNYSAAAYCVNDPDPTPTITGLGGGSFTSSPAGLVINGATGAIDVSASTPNTYTITYTTVGTCPNSSNVNVTINALDDASFNYSAAAYCLNDPDPTPTITGLGGGSFTSSPAGLVINGATGAIDVSASTPNTYTITYTTVGTCPNSSNVNVTINALDDASFNYSAAAYCVNDPDPTPTITGLGGGSFTSSPAGLVINGATGAIDVSASTPNTYTITYTTVGTCPNSSNVNVTITALDDASFNYSAAAYCANDPDPTPTITGVAGGAFTSSPAGLVINGATGAIDLSASTPNTYTITYTTTGACANSSNVNVTVNAVDDASFNYSVASYCENDPDPTPTITGTAGGNFTSSPAGLVINGTTGAIDVSASTPNTYTITYTTIGICPSSSNVNVTINALEDPSFNYSAAAYCASDADQLATITGVGGGTFSSLPAGLSINPATGLINVVGSTPGVYTVTYTTPGVCSNSSNVAVTINALPMVTATNSGSICPEALSFTVDETGGQATSWAWVSNGSATITNPGDQNPTITNAVDGEIFTVTGTDANGCSNTGQTTIVFFTTPAVTATNAGPACSGAAFTVDETGGVATGWSWTSSGGATITNPGDQSPTITGAVDGEVFTVTGTDVNGCINTAQTTISIVPQPIIDPMADVTVCGSYWLPAIQGTNLTGNEAYYDDSQGNGGSVISGELTSTQTVWVYDGNGTCSSEISFLVTVNPIPTASNMTGEGTYCAGDPITDITVDVTGNGPWTVDYTLDGVAQSANGATSPVSLGTTAGVYVLTTISDANCSNTATGTQTIIINTYPTAPLAGTDTEYCSGVFFDDMTASGTGGTFTWYGDSLLTDFLGTGSTLVPDDVIGTTTYYVTETTNGCEGPESMVTITVNACDITVPTAFTPDGDMVNDIWEILHIDVTYPNSEVFVYNRWGNMIYSSDQGAYMQRPWDGTYNGEPLPVGSYYYVIKLNDESAEKDSETGTVSIILNK